MKVFDEAYERVQDFFENVSESAVLFVCELGAFLFAIIIYSTLPIWVVPYKIAKKRKKSTHEENNIYKEWITPSDCNCRCSINPIFPDETLSPETKQAILDDFMKNSEQ